MMSINDVNDILQLNVIGAVPDDENIVVATNKGQPLVGDDTMAGQAYMNICHRIIGEEVPFLDLNGKDIALDRQRTEKLTYALGERLHRPVVAGSDTHQAVQYGCICTQFEIEFDTISELRQEMDAGRYTICVHPEAAFKVKTAGLLKRSLKEIHALGGDYVSVLLRQNGESPAVLKAKGQME